MFPLTPWLEFVQLLSDDRFFILRLRKLVNRFGGMREHVNSFYVRGNISIEGN